MMILSIIFWLFFIYISVPLIYVMILTAAAFFYTKPKGNPSAEFNFAVVIPAKDEERHIEKTVRHVLESEYPSSGYDVIVLADNCNDRTAQLAEKAGAIVYSRTDAVKLGKGYALEWLFTEKQHLLDNYNAIVIIDADTIIDPQFLAEASCSLAEADIQILQGYDGVANIKETPLTALNSAAFNIFNHVRPAGRNRIGGTAGLKGNGMVFRSKILKEFGWPAHSSVEDLEFSLLLLMKGIRVIYDPDAVVYAEVAADKQKAESQRIRWEGGRFQILYRFLVPLTVRFLRKPTMLMLDAILDLITPPLSLMVVGNLVLLLVTTWFYPAVTFFPLFYMIGLAAYAVSGLILRKAPFYVWLCMATAPFFIIWKIGIYFKIIQKRNEINVWKRTERN